MKTLKLILEAIVIVGYVIGLFPFMYAVTCWFVIPLVIFNTIIAFVINNSTGKAILNLLCSFISLVPFLGFFTRIAGIVFSIMSIVSLTNDNNTADKK